MANWEAIKTEYVTSAISYRALARKYGISPGTLACRARREQWTALRTQQTQPLSCLRQPEQQQRLQRLLQVTDQLLVKLSTIVSTMEPTLSACSSLRHISGTLKDIKDIQMLRSDADIREQEAKIAGLQKRSEEEAAGTVEVVLQEEVAQYAG